MFARQHPAHLLAIGIATLDHVYAVDEIPSEPRKHRAKALTVVGGGLAATGAVAAARLGGAVDFITRLGDDLVGREILAELESLGVSTHGSRAFPGLKSPISTVIVDRRGERLVLSFAEAAMPDATGWLPRALPAGCGAVLGDTRWEAGAKHLFRLARAAGVPAVLDADRAPADRALLDVATHVAFSAPALRELTGLADLRGALLSLDHPGVWLAVTDGENGALWREGRVVRHGPAFPVAVLDTLGAGDVWHGAFALALAEGRLEPEAARFANGAAALKCTRAGGRAGIPTRAELDVFLEDQQR